MTNKERLVVGCLAKERPAVLYDLQNGQGTKLYRHNITEVDIVEDEHGGIHKAQQGETPTGKGFEYNELRVEYPVTADETFRTLINAKYGADRESQMQNEYKSAELGILDESYKAPYVAFLNDRVALRAMIDEDFS